MGPTWGQSGSCRPQMGPMLAPWTLLSESWCIRVRWHDVEWTRRDVPYSSCFIANAWLNDLEDIAQGQRSLHITHPLILLVIFAKYKKNLSRTLYAVEQTQDVIYSGSPFIAKSWPNNLEDIGQGRRSSYARHSPMWSFMPNIERIHPELYELQSGHGMQDGWTDKRTDKWNQYTPQQLHCVWGINMLNIG